MIFAKDKHTEWLVREIEELRISARNVHWKEIGEKIEYGPDENEDEDDYWEVRDTKEWLFNTIRSIYYKTCVFMELKGISGYLNMFVSEFNNIINDQDEVLKENSRYSEDTVTLTILDRFNDYLNSFPEFAEKLSIIHILDRLGNILKNSPKILAISQTTPEKEKTIYDAVENVIGLFFPTVRRQNKARNIHANWTYHPDILIPEISTAIEYKFIRRGDNYEDHLNQILIDSKHYIDNEYKYYFAVVYFQDSNAITEEIFNTAVKEKNLPDNWSVICCW